MDRVAYNIIVQYQGPLIAWWLHAFILFFHLRINIQAQRLHSFQSCSAIVHNFWWFQITFFPHHSSVMQHTTNQNNNMANKTPLREFVYTRGRITLRGETDVKFAPDVIKVVGSLLCDCYESFVWINFCNTKLVMCARLSSHQRRVWPA